jgi:uncharacterized protein YdeI (YjbR/CyaY-like superfamily)
MNIVTDLPILSFASASVWDAWLSSHHVREKGVWLRFFKKGSGRQSVRYDEAVEVALCYGWIDSQVKSYDAISYLQKFTPRGPKSIWSKINTQRVIRLLAQGRMKPAGLAAVDRAKLDGRWKDAYDSPKTMQLPEDFLELLDKNKKAKESFSTLSKANRYAIAWRLQTAKRPETRERRMKLIVEMLSKGEKLH